VSTQGVRQLGVGPTYVYALAVLEGVLHVGGAFQLAGGPRNLASWSGEGFQALPGMQLPFGAVDSLFASDALGGPWLYVGGDFGAIGGVSANDVARWDGSAWSALPGQLAGTGSTALSVNALAPFEDGEGNGPALAVAGTFHVSPAGDSFVARWGGCGAIGIPYCFGDGGGAACPCGNQGDAGRGCANSSGAGAALSAGGSAGVAADDLLLQATALPDGGSALLFAGQVALNGGDGVPFGDGLRCAGGAVQRLGIRTPSALGTVFFGPGLAVHGGYSPGDLVHFQVWYRDPTGGPCGNGFNLTNGYELTWQ
jgi:hypothetical protein